jgi:hypothetical protein
MAAITPDTGVTLVGNFKNVAQSIDTIIIPDGHDLNGHVLNVQYSDNGVSYFDPAGWTDIDPIPSGIITGSWTAADHNYWAVTITGMDATAHDWPELILTKAYEISRLPYRTSNAPINKLHNAERETSVSGDDRFTRYGPSKWRAVYPWRLNEADKDIMLGLLDGEGNVGGQTWRGQKPFYLKDVGGTWRYVTITNDPKIVEIAYEQYEVTIELQEVVS